MANVVITCGACGEKWQPLFPGDDRALWRHSCKVVFAPMQVREAQLWLGLPVFACACWTSGPRCCVNQQEEAQRLVHGLGVVAGLFRSVIGGGGAAYPRDDDSPHGKDIER